MSTILQNVDRSAGMGRTLLASAVRTETTTGSAVQLPDAPNGYAFVLDVTAAATAAGDTLNVQVQTSLDGTNYIPVVSFTEVLGNGGALRHVAKITSAGTQAMFLSSASLAAGSVRNLIGDKWRVVGTIVDATTDDASFTYSVTAIAM